MTCPLTIITLQMNVPDYTQEFFRTVVHGAPEGTQYILVDNGSSRANLTFAKNRVRRFLPQLEVVENAENKGFAGGVNQALAHAQGHYVLLSNNDTVWPAGWYEPLREALRQDNVRMTFPTYSTGMSAARRNDECADPKIIPVTRWTPHMPSMVACFSTVKWWWDGMRGLNESYWPASGEDADFICRTWDAGFDINITEHVWIRHVGKGTASTLDDWQSTWKAMSEKFQARWGVFLHP